jgi:hypothetical protein
MEPIEIVSVNAEDLRSELQALARSEKYENAEALEAAIRAGEISSPNPDTKPDIRPAACYIGLRGEGRMSINDCLKLLPVIAACTVFASCKAECAPGFDHVGGYCVPQDAGASDSQAKADSGAVGMSSSDVTGAGASATAGTGGTSAQGGASGSQNSGGSGTAGGAGGSGTAGAGGSTSTAGSSGTVANGGASAPSKSVCGNSKKEDGEICDGNDCPTRCDPATNACLMPTLAGSAAHCDAVCTVREITECKSGDGCCPTGCKHATDDDCPAKCGDGIVDPGEKCEPKSTDKPCPGSCDDNDPCTKDMLIGAADQCTAECVRTTLTRSGGGSQCDDGNPCTDDTSIESTTSCTYECRHSTPRNRSGGGSRCDDGNPCTDDMQIESTTACAYDCKHPLFGAGHDCGGGKMCNAGVCQDPPQRCGNGVLESGEECEPTASGWSARTCSSTCKRIVYQPCETDADCPSGLVCPLLVGGTACAPRCSDSTDCPTLPNASPPECARNMCWLPCFSAQCPDGLSCKHYDSVSLNGILYPPRDACSK